MYEKYVDIYLDALEKEINSLYKGEVLDTLYIGGGTPTSLDINRLTRLLQILKKFKLSDNYEFTFECNIENTDKEKLELLKYYGVNRLSFGVQSFNKNMLKLLNRDYTKEDIFDIIDTAHIVGFKNINIDLITFFILYPFFFLLEGIQLLLQQQVSYIQPL